MMGTGRAALCNCQAQFSGNSGICLEEDCLTSLLLHLEKTGPKPPMIGLDDL